MKILNFYTDSCVSCKPLKDILKKVKVEVEDINALEDLGNVDEYNICVAPTLIFLNDNNEEVARTIGLQTLEDIEDIINTKG